MNDDLSFFERFIATLFLPATIYGAGGALLHSARTGRPPQQVLLEVFGGALTTNMLAPLIVQYCPLNTHCTFYFIAGWGGLELVARLYEAFVAALERRIHTKINPGEDRE